MTSHSQMPPMDSLSPAEQVREAAIQLAVLDLSFPFIFELAHWLRG